MQTRLFSTTVFGGILLLAGLGSGGAANAAPHSHRDWKADRDAYRTISIDRRVYAKPGTLDLAPTLLSAIQIDAEDFRVKLEELTGARDTTVGDQTVRIAERSTAAGRELARKWLMQEYEKLGFKAELHVFAKGANVVAERKGTSGKVLIVSSHMDSVGNAGADDDGSGTIAALLIAQALKDLELKHTLRFVAFDLEETGLVGSRNYVADLKEPAQVVGAVHMEMMAYNSRRDGKFHLIDCDRGESVFLTKAIMESIQGRELPLTRVKACTDRSDHASFWNAKIPAVVLSENFFGGDGDVCYHRKCDVVDGRLDLKYASLIATGVATAVSQLVVR
ncbi:MAG: M28 family metallopeptidase [Bacteriovoracia bacterium]